MSRAYIDPITNSEVYMDHLAIAKSIRIRLLFSMCLQSLVTILIMAMNTQLKV